MEKKHYLWIIALLIISTLIYLIVRMNTPEDISGMESFPCGNKTVFRYKFPEKMYPTIIRDYSTNVNITTDLLREILSDSSGNTSLSVNARNNAKQAFDSLSQDNIFYTTNLRSFFFILNSDPCNDSLRFQYTTYIKEMSEKVIQLKKFVSDVSQPANEVKNNNENKKVIAVIDTSKGSVKKSIQSINSNDLVVLKDDKKINQAISTLSNNVYQSSVVDLSLVKIKIYYTDSTQQKASEIDKLLKSYYAQSYLGGIRKPPITANQIVYYNITQKSFCDTVQALLKQVGYKDFDVRPSSDPSATMDHFKIYVAK